MSKIESSILDSNSTSLPNGWEIGKICVMITNKKKGYTQEYTVTGYNGRYFELRDKRGGLHRASVSRMFKSRNEAIQSWQQNLGGERK